MSMRRIWNLADKAGLDAVKHKAKKSFDFAKLWPGPVTGVAQGPKAAAAKEFMLGCEEIALCGNSTEERCASLA